MNPELLSSSYSVEALRAVVGEVVLITDHSSQEGSQLPLATAVQRLLGVSPVFIDARHFMSGGTGRAKLIRGSLVLEVPVEDLVVTPSIVLIYEIPPASRRGFERFQHRLRQFGAVCLGSDVEAWRKATEKDRTVECFLRDDIPHMETVTLRRPSLEVAVSVFERLGQDVWTRPTTGMGGDGVLHVTNQEQLRHAVFHYAEVGLAWQMTRDAENFNAEGKRHDFRVIVLQDRPLVASERVQRDPDKPCNRSQGATGRRVCLRASAKSFVWSAELV